MIKYSIIIPTYNEELFIGENIRFIKKLNPDAEIIVADGGSSDRTKEIVSEENIKFVLCKQGRGIQLNEGAKAAGGDVLCFLHADTLLPDNAFELLNEFFQESHNKICRFKLAFDIEHWLLNTYKMFSSLNTVWTKFGDMFIAVRKECFLNVGGFPNWQIFEDVEFLRQVSKKGIVAVLNASVISSARTFTKYGIISQQVFNGISILKYLLGFRNFINANVYYQREMKKKEASIIIFARYPVEGKVKTRLAKTLGNRFAAYLYKRLAKQVIGSIRQVKNIYAYVFYSEESENRLIKKWLGKKYFYAHQEGNDLGERMKNAFRKVFSHGAEKGIIVGTDIPDISKEIVQAAISGLDETDLVIGPSDDGGYYLLGMKKYYPGLFENIKYSTHTVFSETIVAAENLHLSCSKLDVLHDFDTEGDIIRWIESDSESKIKNEVESIYKEIKGCT